MSDSDNEKPARDGHGGLSETVQAGGSNRLECKPKRHLQQGGQYPNGPGHKDQGAAREAALAFAPKLGRRQREALDALRQGPGTAEQISGRIGRHWFVTRPRLSELHILGLAVKTDGRGASAFGGRSTIWREATVEERAITAARRAAQAEKRGEQ
jgi:hypothetical protein